MKLLLSRRVDIIIANPLVFNEVTTKAKVSSQVKALEPHTAITPVYMALARGKENSQEIKQAFEQLIKQLKASPYYQVLLDKYQLNVK